MENATQQNSLLGLYDTFVGGFFSQASIFTLGIMPYISASIIIQLLGAVVPYPIVVITASEKITASS